MSSLDSIEPKTHTSTTEESTPRSDKSSGNTQNQGRQNQPSSGRNHTFYTRGTLRYDPVGYRVPSQNSFTITPASSSLLIMPQNRTPNVPNIRSIEKPKQENRNKFVPLESRFAPFAIHAWSSGLAAVKQRSSDQVDATNNFLSYAFPDAALLATPKDDNRKARFIANWLLLRDASISTFHARGPEPLLIGTQQWRDLLCLGFSPKEKKDTKSSKRLSEALKMLTPETLQAIRANLEREGGPAISWHGHRIIQGTLPDEEVVRQIIWELYGLNFMYELQHLGRRACDGLDLDDHGALHQREIMISCCFPPATFKGIVQTIPSANMGFASDTILERLGYILPLAKLMSSWRGEKPRIIELYKHKEPNDISQEKAIELELEVARFYCQTFYDYFNRAAQIPHRLFSTR